MEKKEKLGFFKKMFLVMTDFRTYPFLVKHEKFYESFAYLLMLALVISLLLSLNIFMKFNDTLEEVIENYDETIPEFELSETGLNVSKKIGIELKNDVYLLLDTDYTYEEYKTTKEYEKLLKYDTIFFINNDKIITNLNGEPLYEIKFSNFLYSLNKDSLLEELINYSKDPIYKIYLFFSMFISVFVFYFITVVFRVIFVALILSIISIFFGIRLNFLNYIKISIYSYTLPLLIELLTICVVGTIKDYARYTIVMLTYVYAIYAMRAIKLDAFIVMFSGKKNVKHTSSEFEKELEKYKELIGDENEAKEKDDSTEEKNENTSDEENNDNK